MIIKQVKTMFWRLPMIFRLLLFIGVLMFVYGALIHYIEPEQFPTIFDGIWWAFVTGATVGYGDYVPLTSLGRILALLLILTGGGLIAFYISTIATETVRRETDLKQGKRKFKGSDPFIFIGLNERTRQLIEMTANNYPNLKIVLIDRTVKEISFNHLPVHFIHGDPAEDEILEKANIHQAQRVLITADHSKSEQQADKDTIITTIAVRGNNPNVPIITEVLTKIQTENALRAGATTIIRNNDFMSSLLFQELIQHQNAASFENVMRLLKNEKFVQQKLPECCHRQSFSKTSAHMMEKGFLLLGIVRNGQEYIHPKPSFTLQKGDVLISLADWKQ